MKEAIKLEVCAFVCACAIPFAEPFPAVVLALVSVSMAFIGGEMCFHDWGKEVR